MDEAASAAILPYAAWFDRPWTAVLDDLVGYVGLLRRWQTAQNLVSRETLDSVWTRHVADSLQILRLLRDSDRRFLDIGSGGDSPAIPLAIARKATTKAAFVLVEPNQRKAAFLRAVARALELPTTVLAQRIEEIDSRETISPDIITARAVAPLTTLCKMAAPFMVPQTRAIFQKGREFEEELADLSAFWHHDVVIVRSDTDSAAALLEFRQLRLKTID